VASLEGWNPAARSYLLDGHIQLTLVGWEGVEPSSVRLKVESSAIELPTLG
jgi:hypothetical protein